MYGRVYKFAMQFKMARPILMKLSLVILRRTYGKGSGRLDCYKVNVIIHLPSPPPPPHPRCVHSRQCLHSHHTPILR